MTTRPDFSPAMLAFFLRARAYHAHACKPARCGMQATVKRLKAEWRRLAKLTNTQIDLAWMGRLNRAEPRTALWAVLGHFPADHGILLSDDGGQFLASRAAGAQARRTSRDGRSALPLDAGGGRG